MIRVSESCAKKSSRESPTREGLGDHRRKILVKAGWPRGCVSALDVEGRTIWIVDAHGYGKRFIVRAEEILTAFLELERAIHEFAVSLIM